MPYRAVPVSRRAVLRSAASFAGAAILGACGGEAVTVAPTVSGMNQGRTPSPMMAPTATIAAQSIAAATTASTAIPSVATTPVGAPALTLDPGKKITIEFWYSVVSSATLGAVHENIRRFNQTFPNVTVSEKNFSSYPELSTAVQAATAAKVPPALAGIGNNFLTYTIATFPHLTITEAARRDPQGTAWLTDNFIPSILDVGKVNGVQHAMPLGISNPLLFYNKDLLRQVGLDQPPQTWVEIAETARRTTAQSKGISLAIRDNGSLWDYQALMESNGARILSGSGTEVRVGLDSPEAIEAMQLVADMALKDKTTAPIAASEMQPAFFSGKLAMLVDSSSNIANYKQNARVPFGTAMFPTFGQKPRRVPAGGQSVFIFATDPTQQAAAWEFLKSFNSPESLTSWHTSINYLPARKGLVDDPRYLKPVFGDEPLFKPALDEIPDVVPWISWPGKNGLQADKEAFDVVGRVLSGTQDVPTALKEVTQRVNQLIRE